MTSFETNIAVEKCRAICEAIHGSEVNDEMLYNWTMEAARQAERNAFRNRNDFYAHHQTLECCKTLKTCLKELSRRRSS